MAHMIPSNIAPEVKSNAERHIFDWFKNDIRTKDWIVLHSLGISNHKTVIHGEVDFFVIVPDMGIFALEVKGGRVSRDKGIWSFTDKYGNVTQKSRGPFDQAWEGIFSIIENLKSKLNLSHRHLEKVFYGIGVMFPDIEYTTVGCDEEQWQVFDCKDGYDVFGYIKRLFAGASAKWEKIHGEKLPDTKLPSKEDVEYISSLLRGDFDIAISLYTQIRYSEQEFIRLTNEQYRCLDQLSDNKRCLIEGSAGTGKTLIAIEDAKRASADGYRTAFFCYNRKLAEWIKKYFERCSKDVCPAFVGSFHSFMIKVSESKCDQITNDDTESFFSEELPDKTLKAFLATQFVKFDKIIIDEAQDLISDKYLDVMDKCLNGGLDKGRWSFFGDFSLQTIYASGNSEDEIKELIEKRGSFTKFRLTINCRNTKNIYEELKTITENRLKYNTINETNGLPVNYVTFSNNDEEINCLTKIIKILMVDNHISPDKICILSPVRKDKSIICNIKDVQIDDYDAKGNKNISFSTIQSFKGLESPVIILVDITTMVDEKLMYVALSRARSLLFVIESEQARKEYTALQMRRFLNGY